MTGSSDQPNVRSGHSEARRERRNVEHERGRARDVVDEREPAARLSGDCAHEPIYYLGRAAYW
jgi:hypothetical protein